MRLFLVQHGEARSAEEDPDRPLTDRGARDVRNVVDLAAGVAAITVERLAHSGKTRAGQTAAVWSEALGVADETVDGLAPRDDPAIWATSLATTTVDVMLVGHLPHLAKLVGLLVGGDADRPVVAFRQGGLVGLEQGAAGWSVWLVLPPPAG